MDPPNLKVIAAELLRLKCGAGGATWRCPPLPPLLWLLKHLKAKVGKSVNTSGLYQASTLHDEVLKVLTVFYSVLISAA